MQPAGAAVAGVVHPRLSPAQPKRPHGVWRQQRWLPNISPATVKKILPRPSGGARTWIATPKGIAALRSVHRKHITLCPQGRMSTPGFPKRPWRPGGVSRLLAPAAPIPAAVAPERGRHRVLPQPPRPRWRSPAGASAHPDQKCGSRKPGCKDFCGGRPAAGRLVAAPLSGTPDRTRRRAGGYGRRPVRGS